MKKGKKIGYEEDKKEFRKIYGKDPTEMELKQWKSYRIPKKVKEKKQQEEFFDKDDGEKEREYVIKLLKKLAKGIAKSEDDFEKGEQKEKLD